MLPSQHGCALTRVSLGTLGTLCCLQVVPARLPEFSLDHLTDLVEDLNKLG